MASNSDTEDRNFYWITRIVSELLRDVLWEILTTHIPPSDIEAKVKRRKDLLRREQLEKICNKAKGQHTTKADWDITNIYRLLRYICPNLHAPTSGWGAQPSRNATTVSDDIERVRLIRNKNVGHPSETRLANNKYADTFMEIEMIVGRIDKTIGTSFERRLTELNKLKINEEQIKDFREVLEEEREYSKTTRDNVQEVSGRVVDLELAQTETNKHVDELDSRVEHIEKANRKRPSDSCYQKNERARKQMHIDENITSFGGGNSIETTHTGETDEDSVAVDSGDSTDDNTRSSKKIQRVDTQQMNHRLRGMLDDTMQRIQDFKTTEPEFYKTEKFIQAQQSTKRGKSVFITGNPGEGKTTLGLALLLFSDSERCVFVRDPDDVKDIDPKCVSHIFVDNIFGDVSFNPLQFDKWKTHFDKLLQWHRKGVCFIFTCRELLVNHCRSDLLKHCLFQSDNSSFFTLSSKSLQMHDRKGILATHVKMAGREMSKDELVSCSKAYDAPFGFPLCARLFSSKADFWKLGAAFFKKPFQALNSIFEDLWKNEKELFVALAYSWITYQEQGSWVSAFPQCSTEQYKETASLLGILISKSVSMDDIFNQLLGIFLIRHRTASRTEYSFSHHLLNDAFGRYLYARRPDIVLTNCTVDFLIANTSMKPPGYNSPLEVSRQQYDILVKRFIQSLQDGKYTARLVEHSVFDSNIFLDAVFSKLEQKDLFKLLTNDSGSVLIHCLHQDSPHINLVVRVLKSVKLDIDAHRRHKTILNNLLQMACAKDITVLYNIDLLTKNCDLTTETFMCSCVGGNVDMVKYHIKTLELELDTDLLSEGLILAAYKGHLDIVNLLWLHGANTSHVSTERWNYCLHKRWVFGTYMGTALYGAISQNHPDVAKFLIKSANLSFKATDKNGYSYIHLAIAKHMNIVLEQLVEKVGRLSEATRKHIQPFEVAVYHRNTEAAKYLIEKGVSLNSMFGATQKRPVHLVAERGLTDLLDYLLQRGASIGSLDRCGHTALHYAAKHGYNDITKRLLEERESPSILNVKAYMNRKRKYAAGGFAALHYAARNGHADVVKTLLGAGAEIRKTDTFGATPIYLAASYGQIDVVHILLDADRESVDVAETRRGFTVVHSLARKGKHLSVLRLISERADIHKQDKTGRTPLHHAVERGHAQFVDELINKGSDPLCKTKRGQTVFHLCESKQVEARLKTRFPHMRDTITDACNRKMPRISQYRMYVPLALQIRVPTFNRQRNRPRDLGSDTACQAATSQH